MDKNFALMGVGGFVAERHLKAIRETNNNLIAALDPNDSVGIIDSYFPECPFFVEFERFDRHIDKMRRQNVRTDYVSICSPNYLHDSHIRFALRSNSHAICEKPLVLNPWNVDALEEIEKESGNTVYTILQLRLHPSIIQLKKKIEEGPKDKMYDVELSYITSRGKWYFISWKGDIQKSGGIATNIGIHFFDMLSWIFGPVQQNSVNLLEPEKASGVLELKNARVKWYLSLDFNDVPDQLKDTQRTYRSIKINNQEIEFSNGFTDLHTKSYQHILDNKGYGIADARESIQIVYDIRNAVPIGLKGDYHHMCK